MKKRDFIRRFSNALRWYLPRSECIDILSDYEIILQQQSNEGEEFIQRFDKPEREARKLIIPKAYYQWTAVFVLSLICIFLLTVLAISNEQPVIIEMVIWLVGTLNSLFCVLNGKIIGKNKKSTSNRVKLVFAFLILFVLVFGCVLCTLLFSQKLHITPLLFIAKSVCALLLFVGIISLIKSRIDDGRWMSIYVLCLTIVLLFSIIFSVLYNMDIASMHDINQQVSMTIGSITGLIGLFCAGWLLC